MLSGRLNIQNVRCAGSSRYRSVGTARACAAAVVIKPKSVCVHVSRGETEFKVNPDSFAKSGEIVTVRFGICVHKNPLLCTGALSVVLLELVIQEHSGNAQANRHAN